MPAVDWGHATRTMIRARRALLLALATLSLGGAAAVADVVVIGGLSIPVIEHALKKDPVVVGYGANPDVSSPDVIALRQLVRRLDPGRIWVVVTPPKSEHVENVLANQISKDLNKDGLVIAVGGYNYYVSTSWGNNAGRILSNAVADPNASLATSLHRAIVAFARADAAAHHPKPLAAQIAQQKAAQKAATSTQTSTTSSQTSTTNTDTQSSATPAAATTTTTATKPKKPGSSSSIGLILVLVAVLVLALIGAGAYGRRARAAAKLRKHVHDDAHAKAREDLTKLGDRIRDMDIDSSMPKADPDGKAAYAQALDCYQDAEKRLTHENDSYEFDHALKAIADGLADLDTAERLFDAGGRAKELLPAEVIDRLTKLAKLHRSGALTDEEFATEKKKILS
jgi:hypothetical protein